MVCSSAFCSFLTFCSFWFLVASYWERAGLLVFRLCWFILDDALSFCVLSRLVLWVGCAIRLCRFRSIAFPSTFQFRYFHIIIGYMSPFLNFEIYAIKDHPQDGAGRTADQWYGYMIKKLRKWSHIVGFRFIVVTLLWVCFAICLRLSYKGSK